VLLGAFMVEIARSDGLITSLKLAKAILKLSTNADGCARLVAAGGRSAPDDALGINERDFEIYNYFYL
jgi:hypothetical protein